MVTLLTCLSAATDAPAIIIPNEKPLILSHQQLLEQTRAFQKKLAQVGIAPTEAVASAFPNGLEYVVSFLATGLQRAIAAPLNPAYKQEEFEFYIEDLKAALLLVPKGAIAKDGEAIRAARKFNTAIAEVYWDGNEVALELGETGGLAGKQPTAVEEPQENDIALILHTSGTTGRPKAVPLTHKNLARTMVNIQNTYALTAFDRTLLVMPLFHVHGLLAGLLTPLMTGGSVIVPPRFSASDFWKHFVAHEANWYTAVPTMHQILLKSPFPSPMPAIRFVRSCSSPLAPAVHKQLERLMNAPVLEAYAMTEASHQMTSNPLPPASRKPGSVGVPQGIDMKIMDDEGEPLAQGEIGEVCIKGENVTSGYIGAGIASPFTKSGYFRTGDQGYMDAEGYLFLTGRIKELINKGGEKISPIELDNVWAQHPQIAEAVSFAIDDELYGQEVAVAVVLKEGQEVSADELKAWFAPRAAKFKLPKKIYFTPVMPKTATGKIQRRNVATAMVAKEKAEQEAAPKEEPKPVINEKVETYVSDIKFSGNEKWLKKPALTNPFGSLFDGVRAALTYIWRGELN